MAEAPARGASGDRTGRTGGRPADPAGPLRLAQPPDLHGQASSPLLKGEPARGARDVVVQRIPRERGGHGPFRPLQADRRHRPPRAVRTATRPPAVPRPLRAALRSQADPDETTDLHDRPDLAPTLARLRHALYTGSSPPGKDRPGPGRSLRDRGHPLVPRPSRRQTQSQPLNPRPE